MDRKYRQIIRLLAILGLGVFSAASVHATIIPIDLNDFFADPEVTVSPAGDTSSFVESIFSPVVLLSNDPGLGDPNVIIAGLGTMLIFDFDFTEAAGETDEFFAFVLDSSGFSAGPAFEFLTSDTSSGSVFFDLSSLILEPFIGLQFELFSPDGGAGNSTLTVSNVRLDIPDALVPVPPVVFLFMAGLMAGLVVQRKKSERRSWRGC